MIYLLAIAVVFFFSIVLPRKSSRYKHETSVSEWVVTGVMAFLVGVVLFLMVSTYQDMKAERVFLEDSNAVLVGSTYIYEDNGTQNKAVSDKFGAVNLNKVYTSDKVNKPTIKTYTYKVHKDGFSIWTFNFILTKDYKKHELVLPNHSK